jgi:hypothetical protein
MKLAEKQLSNLSTPVLLVAILGLTFILRLNFWDQPFQMDEGVYGYIGWGMLDGLVPYKDVFDHKPPGIYLLYNLVFLLSEPTALNIKVFASIYALGTALAVFFLTRKVAGTTAGCLSALLFGIFSCGPKIEGGGANTEVFMILPYTLAAYSFLRAIETGKRRDHFLTGLFIGLACTIKQVGVVNLLWVAGFFLVRIWRSKEWNTVVHVTTDAIAVTFGVVLPWLPFLFYFYLNDALGAFFYWQLSFNLRYIDVGYQYLSNLALVVSQMKIILYENGILWLLALTGLVFLCRQESEKKLSHLEGEPALSWQRTVFFLMATWPIFSFLGIALGGRYYGHYFIQIIPSLAVLGGIGLAGLFHELRARGKKLLRQPVSILLAGILFWSLYLFVRTDAPYYLRYSGDQISNAVYGTPLFSVTRFIGKYLKEHSQPEDLIYVWRSDPEINFYALRKSPSPYLVFWKFDPDDLEVVIRSLYQKPPRYVVAMEKMTKFPALQKYIDSDYHKEIVPELEELKEIIAFEIYIRKEG